MKLHEWKHLGWRLWPDMGDPESARRAARRGAYALLVATLVPAVARPIFLIVPAFRFPSIYPWGYIEFVPVGLVLAIFIFRLSRIAAVTNLAIFVISVVGVLVQTIPATKPAIIRLNFWVIFVWFVWLLFYVHAVRGTFAWHRLTGGHAPAIEPPVLAK